MVKIFWSDFAITDLQNIFEYIARDSHSQATLYIEKLLARTEQLLEFPLSGRVVPEFENEKIRELIEGSYRIVYRISEHIEIVRISHSAMILKL